MTTTPTHPNARILSTWENVRVALVREVNRTKGAGIVKVVVEFDRHGNPVRYTRPTVTRLEPAKRANEGDGAGMVSGVAGVILEGLGE